MSGITQDGWTKTVFVTLMDVFKSNYLVVSDELLKELTIFIGQYPEKGDEYHGGVSNAAMFNALLDSLHVR